MSTTWMFDEAERIGLRDAERRKAQRNKRRREKAAIAKEQRAKLYALVSKPGALASSLRPPKRSAARRSATAGNREQGSKWIRRERRMAIYERDGWRCVWCQCCVADARSLASIPDGMSVPALATLDHFLTRSRGGTNLSSNLLTACMKCNHDRDHMSALQWASKLAAGEGDEARTAWGQSQELARILERALRALERPIVKAPKVAIP